MCIHEVLQFIRRFGLGMSRPCPSCVETTSFSTRFLVSRLAQLSQADHNPFARLDRRNHIARSAPSPESLIQQPSSWLPVSGSLSSATSATVYLVFFFSPEILWILVPERKSTHLSSLFLRSASALTTTRQTTPGNTMPRTCVLNQIFCRVTRPHVRGVPPAPKENTRTRGGNQRDSAGKTQEKKRCTPSSRRRSRNELQREAQEG